MVVRFYLWWKQIKRRRVAIGVAVIGLVVVIALIIAGYWFDWTGFNVYTVTVKSNTTSGTSLPTNITAYLPSKTLWDWLQLLFIPAVLALGGYLFTYNSGKTERHIASERQQDEALKSYLDRMTELILEKNLSNSAQSDEVRSVARLRTLSVLHQLGAYRKRNIIQFLHEADLNSIISLKSADLSYADLHNGNLRGFDLLNVTLVGADLNKAFMNGINLRKSFLNYANLHEADLSGSNLSDADLRNAKLRGAKLHGTNLNRADLRKANLLNADLTETYLNKANLRKAKVTDEQLKKAKALEGATMPDGSIHP